jgi:lactoylglutathione lyase
MIKGIGHIALNVKDMDKSLDFYCNVLGLKKAFSLNDKQGKPWIEYIKVADHVFIELFYNGPGYSEEAAKKNSFNHICLEVDDIFAIAKQLKDKGVKLDVEPVQGVDNNYQAWARDPDGNRIEFMKLEPDSPHMKA